MFAISQAISSLKDGSSVLPNQDRATEVPTFNVWSDVFVNTPSDLNIAPDSLATKKGEQ
jgi:hypothetical protein